MSALIRDQKIVADDYIVLADDAALPISGKFIITLARWQKEGESLKPLPLSLGVRIPNTADIVQIWPLLRDRPLIALEFPSFADGRAYSQARLLRGRYGFSGEIRATGAAVVRDQIHGMYRCGINSFQLRQDQDPNLCLRAFKDHTLAYQAAADSTLPVFKLRRFLR